MKDSVKMKFLLLSLISILKKVVTAYNGNFSL